MNPYDSSPSQPSRPAPTTEDRMFGETTTPSRTSTQAPTKSAMYDAPAPKVVLPDLPKPTAPATTDKQAEALYGGPAPQEYEFTIPLGYEHLVHDPGKHEQFVRYAREQKLTQAQAQALVDLHVRTAYSPSKR